MARAGWTEEQMKAAIQAVLNGKLLKYIQEEYGVPRTTVGRRAGYVMAGMSLDEASQKVVSAKTFNRIYDSTLSDSQILNTSTTELDSLHIKETEVPSAKYCSLSNCYSNSRKNPDLTFFSLPANNKLLAKWAKICNKKEWTDPAKVQFAKKHSLVCSLHFAPNMFTDETRTELICYALPQENLTTGNTTNGPAVQNGIVTENDDPLSVITVTEKDPLATKDPLAGKPTLVVKDPLTINRSVLFKDTLAVVDPLAVPDPLGVKEPSTPKDPLAVNDPLNGKDTIVVVDDDPDDPLATESDSVNGDLPANSTSTPLVNGTSTPPPTPSSSGSPSKRPVNSPKRYSPQISSTSPSFIIKALKLMPKSSTPKPQASSQPSQSNETQKSVNNEKGKLEGVIDGAEPEIPGILEAFSLTDDQGNITAEGKKIFDEKKKRKRPRPHPFMMKSRKKIKSARHASSTVKPTSKQTTIPQTMKQKDQRRPSYNSRCLVDKCSRFVKAGATLCKPCIELSFMKCVVEHCKHVCRTSIDQSSYVRFPSQSALKAKWKKALGKPDNWDPKDAIICLRHFKKDDFAKTRGSVPVLKSNLVPSIDCLPKKSSGPKEKPKPAGKTVVVQPKIEPKVKVTEQPKLVTPKPEPKTKIKSGKSKSDRSKRSKVKIPVVLPIQIKTEPEDDEPMPHTSSFNPNLNRRGRSITSLPHAVQPPVVHPPQFTSLGISNRSHEIRKDKKGMKKAMKTYSKIKAKLTIERMKLENMNLQLQNQRLELENRILEKERLS